MLLHLVRGEPRGQYTIHLGGQNGSHPARQLERILLLLGSCGLNQDTTDCGWSRTGVLSRNESVPNARRGLFLGWVRKQAKGIGSRDGLCT